MSGTYIFRTDSPCKLKRTLPTVCAANLFRMAALIVVVGAVAVVFGDVPVGFEGVEGQVQEAQLKRDFLNLGRGGQRSGWDSQVILLKLWT